MTPKYLLPFRSDSDMGVWWDEAGYPHLPDDTLFSDPRNVSEYALRQVGHGVLVYIPSQKYTAYGRDVLSRSGHYFAIFERQYLVDTWAALYAQILDQSVFDLTLPVQVSVLSSLYGPSRYWRNARTGQTLFPTPQTEPAFA